MEFHYEPSTAETNMKSVGYIRQYAWEKCPRGVDIAISLEKIHIPKAHCENIVNTYSQTGELDIQRVRLKSIAKAAMNMPLNSVAYIPGIHGSDGALVRLISNVKGGFLASPYVIRRARRCEHQYVNSDCEICENSIVKLDNRFDNCLNQGYIIEPFSTLYRDIEFIGRVKIPGNMNRMTGARRDSAGMKEQSWVRVNYYPAV
jgi:hypothetical protein